MSHKHCAWLAVATAAILTGTGATHFVDASAQRSAARPSVAPSTASPTNGQIAALFDRWNAALATGDAHRVADLYAPDAVLLPTVSARIRTTRPEIVDYFQHFLQNKPVGRIQRRIIKVLNRTAAIDTGLYQFTLTSGNGHKSTVNARYTFVYELRGGRWLIVNHHSSTVPAGD
ncbi:SgcJ/EcaC family oxidoreductase [Streptomyces sp. RPT161]|uniref:SgcJ/EcaC family oxidoreductase n=1 Tax=Streptomyces sp. RPT161 TaxID=3015993 RepID=UPI0022B8BED0|nr:SgcJ/EcaC family oxidoreductase [Streptomyces sp. RPT161]